jgi:uncharacterized protein (DUF1501 family)
MSRNLLTPSRRRFLGLAAAGAVGFGAPHLWLRRRAMAQTAAPGSIKHLIYIRLSGGFRFPCAFNGDVAEQFNPFGLASGVPDGVSWGVSRLLERAPFIDEALAEAGMRPVSALADRITVMPTVDHEPLAGGADANHDTGLDRFLTGYVNGEAGFFTRILRGLSARYQTAIADGDLILPPFVMGTSGMARGLGEFAPHRPPVLSGATFEQFGAASEEVPDWTMKMATDVDARMRDRQHPALRDAVDAYIQTRAATKAYSDIFASEALKVGTASAEPFDGLSNDELASVFGASGESTNVRLALRLFHYGCPAVYLDQGGYDYHSGEEDALPTSLERVNRLISGLMHVLPRLEHPDGGTYWDHTVVAFGSEFSRTTGGSRFNSARGSDHSGDRATRWMSMPFFGGPVAGGRIVGASTGRADLVADGTVYSYRSVLNTLLDGLGCDPTVFFPADGVVPDLLGTG